MGSSRLPQSSASIWLSRSDNGLNLICFNILASGETLLAVFGRIEESGSYPGLESQERRARLCGLRRVLVQRAPSPAVRPDLLCLPPRLRRLDPGQRRGYEAFAREVHESSSICLPGRINSNIQSNNNHHNPCPRSPWLGSVPRLEGSSLWRTASPSRSC